METMLNAEPLVERMSTQDDHITETVLRERARLRNFIRKRVPDPGEAEDILQDVFFELVTAYRLPEPLEQVGAWLFKVARNRIIDRFRKKKEQALPEFEHDSEDEPWLAELLPAADAGPEANYARTVLLEALHDALDELPAAQREVFLAHELEGRSFKELAAQSGSSVNTLLARKRYAVLHLRARLKVIYEEFDL
jgi:RNA polymerase sigma factor (sigma-70 family)